MMNQEKQSTEVSCGCEPDTCTPFDFKRRDFIKTAGLTSAMLLAGRMPIMAGPFTPEDFKKIVPPDKKLSKEWIASLYERGKPLSATGEDLKFIGMPINGICTGQIYLGGDGRLWHWNLDSFPDLKNTGSGPRYLQPDDPESPIHQGFVLKVDGKTFSLDQSGFNDITFTSHYPMAKVEYQDKSCPVSAELEAYTPLIPLNRDDSSYPVVVLRYTVKNQSDREVKVAIAGWVDNPSNPLVQDSDYCWRECAYREFDCLSAIEHSMQTGSDEGDPDAVVFADFESDDYGEWTIEGKGFGKGPTKTKLRGRGKPSAYQGKGIAYSMSQGGVHAGGKLVSPQFKLEKPFINFLIGGFRSEATGVRLIIDGKAIRSTRAMNSHKMRGASWNVEDLMGKEARIEIIDAGPGGYIAADHFEFSTRPIHFPALTGQPDYGAMALGLLEEKPDWVNLQLEEDAFARGSGSLNSGDTARTTKASLGKTLTLKPGEEKSLRFALSWRFPNFDAKSSQTWDRAAPLEKWGNIRHHYASLWSSASEAAVSVSSREEDLRKSTRSWVDTWYDSTLPYWFLERTFVTLDCIQTQTTQRFIRADGLEHYNFEEGVKCCPGNCTHVWQYAHGLARLFPEIERECRDKVEYGLGFQESGLIHYRYGGGKHSQAVDGQCGTILRVLRESQMTTDMSFLESIWPRTKLSMEYVIKTWDADEDGILSGPQHNTLDAAWHGEVPWLINLYHAALKASAVMARQMGEGTLAERYEALVVKGVTPVVENLWNEEYGYFIHKRDPKFPKANGSDDGCHIDQIMGDSWAWNVGIGRILPQDKIRQALKALWTYNFVPDVGIFRKTFTGGRWYATAGDAGLIMCSYPQGTESSRLSNRGFAGYLNECMTGFEWQVATHMIWEDMLEEGLAIGKAINDRYQPALRNPYNEIECSDHYARAMASYGAYMAVSGYHYDGPAGKLAFGPKMQQDDFRAAFTAAEGWGRFTQTVKEGKQMNSLELTYGKLNLKELTLDLAPGAKADRAIVKVDGQDVDVKLTKNKESRVIVFTKAITISKDQKLEVEHV
ncbi:MAG: GH116 family glycosyl-hydrolase [Verrucomicrobiota bacterium]